MEFRFRNVNDAFRGLVEGIHTGRVRTEVEPSRAGEVMRVPEPVLIHYTHPRERVLLNGERDANPFLHLYEALWTLAGRNDVAPLAYYNGRMRDYSDDGQTLNGAYGYRWRHSSFLEEREDPYEAPRRRTTDQLDLIVQHLKSQPHSRRAVLTMWNVEDDLLKVGGRCLLDGEHHTSNNNDPGSKDVCCNTHVYFDVEAGGCRECDGTGRIVPWADPSCNTPGNLCPVCGGMPHEVPRYLNMTVCNRSNDLKWGLLGTNYVTFTFLQEYMAARLGLDLGTYRHFTNNLHCYTSRWFPEKWLREPAVVYPSPGPSLVRDPAVFERELRDIAAAFNGEDDPWLCVPEWKEPFFSDVAAPMLSAFWCHKLGPRLGPESGHGSVTGWLESVAAPDWQTAARTWMERRAKRVPAG